MEAQTLQSHGFQVHVICPATKEHPERHEVLGGVQIYRFPLPFEGRGAASTLAEYTIAMAWISYLTIRTSIKHPLAAVQVCNPPDILFAAAWLARLIRRSRIVFDHHDLCPELWVAKSGSLDGFFGKALLAAEAMTFKSAAAVISTNESYKEIAETRGKKAPESVSVVRSSPRRSFAIEQLPATRPADEATKLAYLGTMGSQEGIDILLDAVEILRTDLGHPDIQLDLVGGGPERESLQALSAEMGLGAHVRFHGRLPDKEMSDVLSSADIGVNPDRPSTLNRLSTMNKIVEYMALGLPVVQFDCVEGKRSALEASKYVVEPTARALAESISALLNDSNERDRMRKFGYQRFLTDLCWETQEDTLAGVYRSLVS
jgi:glycosyltransferase involved in cell wall biosynthesis